VGGVTEFLAVFFDAAQVGVRSGTAGTSRMNTSLNWFPLSRRRFLGGLV
jgi:hypothetical protein